MAQLQSIPLEIAAWRRKRLEESVAAAEHAESCRSVRRIRVGNREVVVLKRARHLPAPASG